MIEPRCPNENRETENRLASRPEFPSARYFQIHFEHLESLLNETRRCLEILKQQVEEAQAVEAAPPPPPEDRPIAQRIKAAANSSRLGDDQPKTSRIGKGSSLSLNLVADR
ncbi:MAG: hypothetical protein PHE55_21345 [Methylococcaceae bacterium]|nr:hypothetical protein [Methylococcaceae bacterium]